MDNTTLLKPGHLTMPLPTNPKPLLPPLARSHSSSVPSARASGTCDCACSSSFLPHQAFPNFRTSQQQLSLLPHHPKIFYSSTSRRSLFPLGATAAEKADGVRTAVDGDDVLVHYTGKLEDGTLFDSSVGKSPLSFTLGARQVVSGFDDAVRGMQIGQKKTATLPPEQAYGERRDDMLITVPKEKAPEGLKVGETVQFGTPSGQRASATVKEIGEDGSITMDANHMLAGKTLVFDLELVGFRELLAPSEPPPGLELATFAAGCFWGVELAFQRVPGVVSTNVGYAQGQKEKPTYQEVCGAGTGHTEAVRVVFDPQQVSFATLLELFWKRVGKNAVTLNVAGNDRGPQYRSGVYFHNAEQEKEARSSLEKLQEEFTEKIITEIEEAAPFWLGEDYHQQYLEKGGQSAEKGSTEEIRCYG